MLDIVLNYDILKPLLVITVTIAVYWNHCKAIVTNDNYSYIVTICYHIVAI